MAKAHPGFKKVAQQIAAKGGYDIKTANAILAAKTRQAGKTAVKKNPALKKVKRAK